MHLASRGGTNPDHGPDGNMLSSFQDTVSGKINYFLFRPASGLTVECDKDGLPLPGHIWIKISVQQFVLRRSTNKSVSAAGRVNVLGMRLKDVKVIYLHVF